MNKRQRNSGIDAVGDVPWGTHFCQFYQTKEDLTDILVPYFKAGLENNEFCLWVTSQPLGVEEAKESLKKTVPDIDVYLERGQIEIIPHTHVYVNEGVFDSERVLNGWIEKLNHALASGYNGLRLTGNTSWLEKKDWNGFVSYEGKADSVIGNYQMIALCAYFLDKCNATEIIDVVINHQFALIKRDGKWEQIESPRRKKVEEAAIQATKNWEYTFDAVPDLIAIVDTEHRIVRANNAMAAKLGVTPEECVGLTCYRVIHGTDEPPSFCPHCQMLKDGVGHTKEVREDSLCGDFIVSVSPLRDSEGRLTGCIHVARDITERKQAEEALRESEEKYRNLMDTANEGIWILEWILDSEARTIYVNKKMAEMLGCSREEMIGKSVRDFTDEEGKAIFEMNMKRRRQGINESHEFRLLRKDGLPLWALVNSKALFDKDGKFTGSMSMLTDITKRKEAENKLKETLDNLENLVKERTAELEKAYKSLKESENSLAEAQRMARVGNWDLDIATGKVYWSDEMYRIYGRNPQEPSATYDELLNYVHPDDQDCICDIIKKGLKGDPHSIDYRIVLANGEERIVYGQTEVVFDENNIPVRVKGTTQDITELKKAEKALKLSEERYRIITEQTGQLVYDCDIKKETTDWAGNIKELTGFTPGEFGGMSLKSWLSRIHPGDRKSLMENYKNYLRSGEAYSTEYRFRKKDEEYIYFEDNGICLKDEKGNVNRILGVIKDITERKQAEETLEKIETARKKEIHHRIKNNLQVISSLLDLQSEKFRNRECVGDSEVLNAFRESQDRVMSIALIHEELHEGKRNDALNFSPYLKRLAKNLFQTYRLGNADTKLHIDLEENIFFDMDTAVPLGIIINELVSNSLKHAFPGRNKGVIRIKLFREKSAECTYNIQGNKKEGCKDTNFILIVSDNGVGMPGSFNSESSDSLGIQLVTILVDQLRGEIELKRDSGTEFVIRFTVKEKH